VATPGTYEAVIAELNVKSAFEALVYEPTKRVMHFSLVRLLVCPGDSPPKCTITKPFFLERSPIHGSRLDRPKADL